MQKIRIKYSKLGRMRFIGHLDLLRAFERAFRRTDLSIAYSEGFNPRLKLSWGPPLSLGIESECELVDAIFERWTKPEDVKTKLNEVLPEGLKIIDANLINPAAPSIVESMNQSEFLIEISFKQFPSGEVPEKDIMNKIAEFTTSSSILVVRERTKGNKTIDLKKMVHSIKILENDSAEKLIRLQVFGETSNNGSLKIFELLDWLGIPREAIAKLKRISLAKK